MTPSILLRNGKLSFVTGSPGDPTIISVTLLSIINWMRLGMDAQTAINAPRFHHQWFPDRIRMEAEFPLSVEQALRARGHEVERDWRSEERRVGKECRHGGAREHEQNTRHDRPG